MSVFRYPTYKIRKMRIRDRYYQLIREQQAVAQKKNHIDSIVGRTVADFLELSISEEGKYYSSCRGGQGMPFAFLHSPCRIPLS